MKVFFAGVGDPRYSRTRILIDGLRQNGVEVEDFFFRQAGSSWPVRLVRFLRAHRRAEYDVLWVGLSGQYLMPLFRAVARGPVVLDAYFSLYQTVIEDKELHSARGPWGAFYRLADRWSCRLSHRVVLDTRSQIDYFLRRYLLWPGKFACVPVGADERLFPPLPAPPAPAPGSLRVGFWGSFIPLQGVGCIVEAAARLRGQGIEISLLGDGPERPTIESRVRELQLDHVRLLPRVAERELAAFQAGVDVCLGIFGASEKAGQVVPNKAYAALASGRLLVTADSAAAREDMRHGEHAWLVPANDPEALARALLHLRDNPVERERIAHNGLALFQERFSAGAVGARAAEVLRGLTGSGPVCSAPLSADVDTRAVDGGLGADADAETVDLAMMCDHRPDLAAMVPPTARRVLDVGCGVGYLGQVLRARGQVEVVGVEVNRAAARQAATRLDAAHWRLEEILDRYPPAHFDCIIFGDVLEHMADPWSELRRYVTLLRNGGAVVASLPNVAHWSVIWQLLRNRFTYEARGIRCNSHLRFFTRRTAVELLESAGLEVVDVRTSYRLADRRLGGLPLRLPLLCRLLSLGLMRHLFAFQYRFLATRRAQESSR